MFPKLQTPMHLKIDLDQVHFTELGIWENHLLTIKNIKTKHNTWVIFNTRLSPSPFFPNKF